VLKAEAPWPFSVRLTCHWVGRRGHGRGGPGDPRAPHLGHVEHVLGPSPAAVAARHHLHVRVVVGGGVGVTGRGLPLVGVARRAVSFELLKRLSTFWLTRHGLPNVPVPSVGLFLVHDEVGLVLALGLALALALEEALGDAVDVALADADGEAVALAAGTILAEVFVELLALGLALAEEVGVALAEGLALAAGVGVVAAP